MDKKTQIKQLETELNETWKHLIESYYKPLIKKTHQLSVIEISKCQDQECVDKWMIKREAPIKYLKKVTKTYESGLEDCIYNCKYSMQLEMEDCYIDCFKNIKQIVNKLHEF